MPLFPVTDGVAFSLTTSFSATPAHYHSTYAPLRSRSSYIMCYSVSVRTRRPALLCCILTMTLGRVALQTTFPSSTVWLYLRTLTFVALFFHAPLMWSFNMLFDGSFSFNFSPIGHVGLIPRFSAPRGRVHHIFGAIFS